MIFSDPPALGQIVRARSRQYLVEGVTPPPKPGDQTLVRLSCLDDDAQGVGLEVLWESEVDAVLAGPPTWQRVAERDFDAPAMFSAYLHSLRWNCVTSTNPRLFQAPFRAGIEVMAYQLEPLRKALLLPRVNLFIADDVGLGKTIEAGLILRELILRQKVRRVVVACPPSVLVQWKEELETRFGLPFVVLNRDYVSTRRRERGFSVNPWTTHTRFIISHALLRDESYAGSLRDWLGDSGQGTLLILDEAHNAAPATSSRYAIDSKFTRVIRDLAPRFEHRLFLSATPHNGHSNSFAALLELLDPQRFCRGVPVKSVKSLEAVMVRRLKEDLRQMIGGFPERRAVQHDIDGLSSEAPELRLPRVLDDLRVARDGRLRGATKSQQAAAGLIFTSLQKRLLSSIEAFALTLRVHRKTLARHFAQAEEATPVVPVHDLFLLAEQPGSDDERAELDETEVQAEENSQMEAATTLSSGGERALIERELNLIDEMLRIADEARGMPCPRIVELVSWIRENMCPDLPTLGSTHTVWPAPRWNDRRVIIFTEYVDTKRYLEQQLLAAIAQTDRADDRIGTFVGGMGEESRKAVKDAFNRDPKKHPLRILIATDAAREGVNLQNHCSDLFHFDVPWNPSRMEQRIGRIDRKLQRAPVVRSHYFVLCQRPEDRVLEVLVKKTAIVRKELGSLSVVLDRRIEKIVKDGITHAGAPGLAQAIDEIEIEPDKRAATEEELEAARESRQDLTRQLDTLRDLLDESRKHLDLEQLHFHSAINSSLSLLGAPPLAAETAGDGPARWRFPALDRRAGVDACWADTLDSLRVPRREEQKPWEWRTEAPIRPIVFSDPGTIDEEVVHLHLEHRVVQRLLGRFLSQGFVHDDLSRACVGQTADAIPRVLLLGRLSLYGDSAARLHDEIITVSARWSDASKRSAPLRPYAQDAEEKSLRLLEESLGAQQARHLPDEVRARLKGSIDQDVRDLQPHLIARSSELSKRALEKLTARGDKESREMTQIITSQRDRIRATQLRFESQQLDLGFNDEERRQLEFDRRHWHRRLASLDAELIREPDRIRAAYVVRATRVDPVGVVYLWPISG